MAHGGGVGFEPVPWFNGGLFADSDALPLERSDIDVVSRAALDWSEIGPANVKGIEVNPYAAELARVSVWIGEIQWMRQMRAALDGLSRYIATPTVAKHRLFAWLDARICPDHQLIVIARDDDTTFGILHSRFHEIWSLRLGTWLGKGNDPRYTPTSTFATFPFPASLAPAVPATEYASDPRSAAIATRARRLVELRDRWLNPPEWVEWADEPVPGYPKRPVPRDEQAAKELKKRTLTNLYNTRPQWLADAHQALDEAVAAAYGWPADISDEDDLRQLLALNGG